MSNDNVNTPVQSKIGRPKKYNGCLKRYSIALDSRLLSELDTIAVHHGLTRSALLNDLIKAYVDDNNDNNDDESKNKSINNHKPPTIA